MRFCCHQSDLLMIEENRVYNLLLPGRKYTINNLKIESGDNVPAISFSLMSYPILFPSFKLIIKANI